MTVSLAFACAGLADSGREALAAARASVTDALDALEVDQRNAALRQAAEQYRTALADEALPPTEAQHARRALRAINTLLASPPGPAPPKPTSTSAAMPETAPLSPSSGESDVPLQPKVSPGPIAAVALRPPGEARSTLAVAEAVLAAHLDQAPDTAERRAWNDAWHHALRAGTHRDGRFGPGLSPPSTATDALHTLIALAALTVDRPLDTAHAPILAATLILEQSPAGGWRDPLSPFAHPSAHADDPRPDQRLATAANLLTLRWIALSPGLPPDVLADLHHARQLGQSRLAELLAHPPHLDPQRPGTFSDDLLDLVLTALENHGPNDRAFRAALAARLHPQLATITRGFPESP